jgi:hypothetical protein
VSFRAEYLSRLVDGQSGDAALPARSTQGRVDAPFHGLLDRGQRYLRDGSRGTLWQRTTPPHGFIVAAMLNVPPGSVAARTAKVQPRTT